jgi:hypothetical protein
MQSDEREEQAETAKFRRNESLEADSIATVKRDRHPAKELSESVPTDAGSESLELGSNVMIERE